MPKKPAKRTFALRKGGKEISIFRSTYPRGAALKAATRGHTRIELRERGTDKVHIFEGSRKRVKAPSSRPSWLPSEIWVPHVKKIGIERLKKK